MKRRLGIAAGIAIVAAIVGTYVWYERTNVARQLIASFPQRPEGWTKIRDSGTAQKKFTIEEYGFEPGTFLALGRVNGLSFGSLTTGGCLDSECQEVRTIDGKLVIRALERDDERPSDCQLLEVTREREGTFDLRQVEPPPCSTDSGAEITVAVYYTAEASAATIPLQGGPPDIEARIKYAEGKTNEALTRSNVPTQIRVLGPSLLTATSLDTAQPGDFKNYIDVNDLRGSADLLVLITTGLDDCGKAFRYGSRGLEGHLFAPFAYAVVRVDCLSCGIWALGHEIGHLMGACHDSGRPCNPFFKNHGYVDQSNSFTTLCARDEDAVCKNCNRINQWSSNTIECDDLPTGSDTENNAQRLRDTYVAVAKFRCS